MINLRKIELLKTKLTYLGFLVSQRYLKMDSSKVKAILNWPTPRSVGDVGSFHGLASFCRRFVRNFSHVCAPILNTIKGGIKRLFK